MLVETFEQTEMLENAEVEQTEEALRLITELGLEGQNKLLSPSKKERVPYREMTAKEFRVYRELFPVETEIGQYDASFIPLRVLQVAAHAKQLGYYQQIYVWSENTRPTDPILVGKISYDKYHILARWGEALAPFEELYTRAKGLVSQRFRVEAEKRIGLCQQIASTPESYAIEHLNGGWVTI